MHIHANFCVHKLRDIRLSRHDRSERTGMRTYTTQKNTRTHEFVRRENCELHRGRQQTYAHTKTTKIRSLTACGYRKCGAITTMNMYVYKQETHLREVIALSVCDLAEYR